MISVDTEENELVGNFKKAGPNIAKSVNRRMKARMAADHNRPGPTHVHRPNLHPRCHRDKYWPQSASNVFQTLGEV